MSRRRSSASVLGAMLAAFPRRSAGASERGQASVELVATVPAVLVVGLVVWQLALTGHAAWLCANAARVAARAEVVGRDAEAAARSALPTGLERGLRVERDRAVPGRVRVSVRVPLLSEDWTTPVTIAATAYLGAAP